MPHAFDQSTLGFSLRSLPAAPRGCVCPRSAPSDSSPHTRLGVQHSPPDPWVLWVPRDQRSPTPWPRPRGLCASQDGTAATHASVSYVIIHFRGLVYRAPRIPLGENPRSPRSEVSPTVWGGAAAPLGSDLEPPVVYLPPPAGLSDPRRPRAPASRSSGPHCWQTSPCRSRRTRVKRSWKTKPSEEA